MHIEIQSLKDHRFVAYETLKVVTGEVFHVGVHFTTCCSGCSDYDCYPLIAEIRVVPSGKQLQKTDLADEHKDLCLEIMQEVEAMQARGALPALF